MTPPITTPATPRSIIDSFTSVLTLSIHTILSQRNLYPPTSFLTTRSPYGFPVRQNRHPGVCSWVTKAVDAVREELERGTGVDRVVVAILGVRTDGGPPSLIGKGKRGDGRAGRAGRGGKDRELGSNASALRKRHGIEGNDTSPSMLPPPRMHVLERFVFDVSHLPRVPKSQLDTPILNGALSTRTDTANNSTHDPPLDEQFRALLARLSVCDSALRPFDDKVLGERTFTVVLELASPAGGSRMKAPEWKGGADGSGVWTPAEPDRELSSEYSGRTGLADEGDDHDSLERLEARLARKRMKRARDRTDIGIKEAEEYMRRDATAAGVSGPLVGSRDKGKQTLLPQTQQYQQKYQHQPEVESSPDLPTDEEPGYSSETGSDQDDDDNSGTIVHPIRTIRSETKNVAFEMWIEEKAAKWAV